jgi:hypothetical protein
MNLIMMMLMGVVLMVVNDDHDDGKTDHSHGNVHNKENDSERQFELTPY